MPTPDPTSRRISDYWKNGYWLVPRVFDASEVDALKSECERLAPSDEPLRSGPRETFPRMDRSGRAVRNLIDPVTPHSPLIRDLIAKPELVARLRGIFEDDPCLFKDKLILRPPGTAGYGLHQDYAYWGWTGIPADGLLALQIAVDDADDRNGAVSFYPGMHTRLLSASANEGNDIDAALVRSERSELVPTKAGDIVVFHSLTPHWSDVNRSDAPRRTIYLTFSSARFGDLYRTYYQERGAVLGAHPTDSARTAEPGARRAIR